MSVGEYGVGWETVGREWVACCGGEFAIPHPKPILYETLALKSPHVYIPDRL